jgi:hypothetical protein
MKKTSTAVVILAFTAACGGGKPLVTGPGPTPTPPPPVCRNYATAMDTTTFVQPLGSSTGSATCTFDRAALSLKCHETTVGPFTSTVSRTSSYASVADFIEEAAVVGRVRVLREEIVTVTGSSSSGINTYTYDAQKRPTRLENRMNGAPFSATAYTAWDALGRPVANSSEGPSYAGSCTLWTTTYDDVARTVTSMGDPGCRSTPTLTTAYDAAGNLLRLDFSSRGATTYSTTSTITATAAVCP